MRASDRIDAWRGCPNAAIRAEAFIFATETALSIAAGGCARLPRRCHPRTQADGTAEAGRLANIAKAAARAAALAPVIVRPEIVTALPLPTFLSPNVPVAPAVLSVTASPDTTPTSDAPPVLSVAAAVPS